MIWRSIRTTSSIGMTQVTHFQGMVPSAGVDLTIRVTIPGARSTEEAIESLRNADGGFTIDKEDVQKVIGRPWTISPGIMK